MGWPRRSDAYTAYDSGAAAVAYWLGRTLSAEYCKCLEMTWGWTLKKALKYEGLPVDFKVSRNGVACYKQRIGRSRDRGRTRNLCLLPRIDPTGIMRVKMNIALRKRALSPVRLVLEDLSKRSFMLFVYVSLQLGSIV